MNTFADVQHQFQAFVMRGERDVNNVIVGDELASSAERLAVYYDAYRLRLLGILETEFPGVCALTTPDQFRQLGLGYLDEYPSSCPSVRWFARKFADYIGAVQEQFELPNLAEMAAFEWARGLAFDARESPVVGPEVLARLPADQWPDLKIALAASVQRVPFVWNTDELWRSAKTGEALAEAALRSEPATCCVWRRDLTVYWRIMDAAEASAFESFDDGHDFAHVCSHLCESFAEAEVPAKAASYLSRWIGEGLMVDIVS